MPVPAITTKNRNHSHESLMAESTGAFNISVGEGKLFAMKSATFTYAGTAGAAIVIYDDAGNVL